MKDAARVSAALEVDNALLPFGFVDHPGRNRVVSNAADHGGEGVSGESLHHVPPYLVGVYGQRPDGDVVVAGGGQQWL